MPDGLRQLTRPLEEAGKQTMNATVPNTAQVTTHGQAVSYFFHAVTTQTRGKQFHSNRQGSHPKLGEL